MQYSRMKISTAAAMLALLAVTTLFLAGCNSGGVGIFYSLENETKIVNRSNLPDTLTIGSMGLLSSPSTYYIGAGKVYEAANDSTFSSTSTTHSWNAVTAPDSTHILCNQIAVIGSKLYAVYAKTDGTSSLLYQSAPTSSTLRTPVWSLVNGYTGTPATAPVDYTVQSLFDLNGNLFVSVFYTSGTNAGKYALYQGGDTSSALVVSGTGSQVFLASPAVGGAYDTSTGTYWVAAGNRLYSGTTTTNLTEASSQPSLGANETYRGIYWSQALNTLFVSTSSGGLYAEKSGTSTFSSTPASWNGVTATGLSGFGEITVGSTDVIVVGADTGYYEMDINPASFDINKLSLLQPGNTGTLSSDVNYLTIALKSTHVIGFFGGTSRLFALSGGGLWRNEPNAAGTSRAWEIE